MGKLSILLLMSISLFAGETREQDFYLKIDLTNREKSKDSNSQRYIVEVKNKNVDYRYIYSGYPGYKKRSKQYKLTDRELSQIIHSIKDEKIDLSKEEKRSTKANGVTRSVDLSLFLKLEGKTTKSKISGNVRIFRASGKIEGELIKNKDYINSVESLIGDLER
ncbi:MAG: hypothetical protein U9R27_01180 [Campylobacterota bacterium]|nr:hypothetical protein [Campylobacterota bacterium]